MPRAEVGTSKYLDNKLKSKGLQRLRWYCQVCERQMRDENGFKCHTQSESHLRQILIVGEDPKKAINKYSSDFQHDFLQLLRTSHGEKQVHANHFYQEYIHNKEHIHMNATKWSSLSEFVKILGREGICRVEENEKGLFISYVDRSPEALARQEAIRKKERQDRGDEEREQRQIKAQIERANKEKAVKDGEDGEMATGLQRTEEKIKINFGGVKKEDSEKKEKSESPEEKSDDTTESKEATVSPDAVAAPAAPAVSTATTQPPKISMKIQPKKPVNVFAAAGKKLSGAKPKVESTSDSKRPMSEAERIMKQEMERKRGFSSGPSSGNAFKKARVA
ncbi:hypothetical protein TWF106_002679 [Orbilia oligospora]|uniref:DNA/RNA-binding protein Kin17 WH-like domain-containing protein n=1 Tax=Orbilia oligospora TaxID=2813651 RepID=A0A6G1MK15_ORBOL|nr:hypothetical protein TWF788_005700 [Orbilia oligospora]KAF3201831.1 hypothetical protein TWF106_002679 [Orbilia oligospora]KAF3211549.1 hypothetical protein TWF679_006353 [Orbilia oligospora]KAF3226996.1 hypothetical protein TWF191_004358 [Orbilia oligospora]KAF3261649.1 hypothetical protein TWF192_008114 [Orbilia oligospora]